MMGLSACGAVRSASNAIQSSASTSSGGTGTTVTYLPSSKGTTTGQPASVPSSTGSKPPTTPVPRRGQVTLTYQDNGQTVTVETGTVIVVDLRTMGSPYSSWSSPMSSNPRTLQPQASGTNSDQTWARFSAAQEGTSTLSSLSTPKCGPKCAAPGLRFEVTINIL